MGNMLIKTPNRIIQVGQRTIIMGIINVTPDSFFDGNKYRSAKEAVTEAMRMVEAGADIIDVGGESTRPGSLPIPLEEELKRVMPIVEALAGKIDVPVSVDTTKSGVARRAIAAGAEIINDISALKFDPLMSKTLAETKAALVMMHMRGTPKDMQSGDLLYTDIIAEIRSFFQGRLLFARQEGIQDEQIILDPGLGFGKTAADNLKLIKNLSFFQSLGRPLLTGVSRKSFTRSAIDEHPDERFEGTAAAVTASILYGSQIIRVHDVAAMSKLARVADSIARA